MEMMVEQHPDLKRIPHYRRIFVDLGGGFGEEVSAAAAR
jgi:hypothetical protein